MSTLLRNGLASMLLVAMIGVNASAQCSTCATPTVAYAPVVAQPQVVQPTVAYRPYTGWYPGKLLDQWRLRRAGVGTTASVYSAAYAPSYTAGYAPAYTASYAPATYTASYAPASYTAAYAPTYTAAYRPYLTSYAPLSSAVATGCSTCTQTVARPVLMRPVVAPACDTCSFTPSCDCGSCGGCDACSSGVSQAIYSQAPSTGCSSCAGTGTTINVLPQSNSGPPSVGPPTGQPDYRQVPEAAPPQTQYGAEKQIPGNGASGAPATEVDPLNEFDPGPASPAEPEADSSTWYYNAPQLLDPRNNTATRTYKSRQPTVDVRTAIYHNQGKHQNVSRTQARRTSAPAPRAKTQAEIDAEGWSSAPSGR